MVRLTGAVQLMRGIKTRLLAAAALLLASSSSAWSMSLKDAVQRATMEHPAIGAAISNRTAVGYEVLQAQGRFLPSVDLSAEVGGQVVHKPGSPPPADRDLLPRRQVGLSVTQVIFDGFDRQYDMYARAARFDAATLRVLQASEFRALQAIEAYIDMRRHSVVLDLARQNVARHREILGTVRSVVQGGKAPQSDIAQTEQRLAAARATAVQIERLLADTRAKFKQAVGVEPGKISRVGLPGNIPPNYKQAVRMAEKHNPQLLAARVDIDAADFTAKQSESAFAPTIALQAAGTYGEDLDGVRGENSDVTGKVMLSWNLYNGNIKDNRTKELQARVSEAEYNYALQARQVEEAVRRAYNGFELGRKRADILNTEVDANRRVVSAYTEEYKLSKRSLLDLLDAEAALFNSRFQWTNAYSLFVFSSYQTLATMGMLLPHFGISRPARDEGGVRVQVQEQGVFNTVLDPLQ